MTVTAPTAQDKDGKNLVRAFSIVVTYAILAHLFLKEDTSDRPGQRASAPVSHDFSAMADLVLPHGFHLEEHFATTEDGYILRLFRIPCKTAAPAPVSSAYLWPQSNSSLGSFTLQMSVDKSSRSNSSSSSFKEPPGLNKTSPSACRPVLLQHALMDSSAGWLLLGKDKALALQLAAAGFDVWMGNSRGNRFSRNHTSLDPEDPKFWEWSWADMAEHDIPAQVDKIVEVTGHEKMVYFGFSQGTMIGLAALSSSPRLSSHISLAILMAPVAFVSHMRSPPFVLSSRLSLDQLILQHWGEWGSHKPVASMDYIVPFCKKAPGACLKFFTAMCGENPMGNIEHELVPKVVEHLPAGTSVLNMAHWAQGVRRKSRHALRKYDFGNDCSLQPSRASVCNQQVYGSLEAPVYNLTAISTPVALFTGGYDSISTMPDIELLKQALAPGVLAHHHHEPLYAHLDFELGSDAPDKVYPVMLSLAAEYSY